MENCDNLLDSLVLKTNKKASLWPLVQTQKCLPHPQPLPQAEIRFHLMISTFKTKMYVKCIFIVTRKDGTLFDATSVLQEDILEICVTLGHTHPLGVLWYLAMESVALFCTTERDATSIMQCCKGNVIARWTNCCLGHSSFRASYRGIYCCSGRGPF